MGLEHVPVILEEVHEGSCGHHLRGRSLALKVLRPVHRSEISRFPRQPQGQAPLYFRRALKANGQVEAANKVILEGLKKRRSEAKGAWADEPRSILWSYRTTPHLTIGETPFKLTYGVDTMRPVEVEELSPRVIFRQTDSTSFREESDLANKVKETTHIRESALKHRIA